jgi:hypothetical protein
MAGWGNYPNGMEYPNAITNGVTDMGMPPLEIGTFVTCEGHEDEGPGRIISRTVALMPSLIRPGVKVHTNLYTIRFDDGSRTYVRRSSLTVA